MKMTIRKLTSKDLPKRVELMADPAIYTQMPVPHPVSLEETKTWFNNLNDHDDSRVDFTIIEERVIGFCGLGNINYKSKNANFYIFLDPQHTGRGYGSKSMKWLLNYGFSIYSLNKIYCYTIASNLKANNFYENIGLKKEGCLKEHLFHLGSFVDRNCYGLLRSEWKGFEWSECLSF